MDSLLDPKSSAAVRDVFEIKAEYRTSYAPGVVAVLDRVITHQTSNLVGKTVIVEHSNGQSTHFRVDDAKDHLAATSLYFGGLTTADIKIGDRVCIAWQVSDIQDCAPNKIRNSELS